jgi:hypothetical protein
LVGWPRHVENCERIATLLNSPLSLKPYLLVQAEYHHRRGAFSQSCYRRGLSALADMLLAKKLASWFGKVSV